MDFRKAPAPAVHGRRGVRRATGIAIALATFSLPLLGRPAEPNGQEAFSRRALDARLPVVREEHYVVNARVRPLLFWIGRDDVGDGRITWRKGAGDHRALELLVGSDPARAPRKINRWGFIVEEVNGETGQVLGFMKESAEQTLEDARASTEGVDTDRTTYKAVRTIISGSRAVSGTLAFPAPSDITYHQLDALLSRLPAEPRSSRTTDLPAHAERGFLLAMASLIHESVAVCRSGDGAGVKALRPVPYLYNQTLYDLAMSSCEYAPELRTKVTTCTEVVKGRFQVRNRRTGAVTKFHLDYGLSNDLREVPVRIEFRPHWWIEIELLLDRKPRP